jgi:hypothetical protein
LGCDLSHSNLDTIIETAWAWHRRRKHIAVPGGPAAQAPAVQRRTAID